MANRYTIGSGLASDVAIWDGGASVPVEGDRVLIMSGHTVTLDGTYVWGDDSTSTISINSVSTTQSITVMGVLKASRSVNSQFTCKGTLDVRNAGRVDFGSYSDPIPSGVTATLVLNYSATPSVGKYMLRGNHGCELWFYGAAKTRITKLTASVSAGATSGTVLSATGWAVGDKLYFPNTSTTTDNQHETKDLSGGYTPGSTTLALPALTYAHANNSPIANLTSNVTVKAYSSTYGYNCQLQTGTNSAAGDWQLGYCTFERPNGSYSGGLVGDSYGFTIGEDTNYTSTPFTNPVSYFNDVAIWNGDTISDQFPCNFMAKKLNTEIVITRLASVNVRNAGGAGMQNYSYTQFDDCLFGGYAGCTMLEGGEVNRGYVCVQNTSGAPIGSSVASAKWTFDGTIFLGPAIASVFSNSTGTPLYGGRILNADIEETFTRGSGTNQFRTQTTTTFVDLVLENCYVGSRNAITDAQRLIMTDDSLIKHINKNRDVTLQEEYYRRGVIQRNSSEKYRSTSSMRMTPGIAGTALPRQFKIAVASGETVRLIGYCKYDSAYYNGGTGFVAPTLTLSGTINGVSLTPVTYTATSANAGNWELIDKSITNSAGAAGELTLTFSAQCGVTNGNVYWDGIAVAPMVVLARHYGFVFDEANPKRTVNPTVSASESTADGYTGFTISWGASSSSVTVTADNTFQKLYDHTQAKGCLNLDKAMPITGAGLAGNPVLFAQGNVTINTTKKLNGSGSLSMDAFTLTTEFATAGAYTYTGGTWSQQTTTPTFSGGTLNIGAAGAYEFDTAGTVIVNLTPTSASAYNLGDVTASGTLDLRNTSGVYAIDVALASGVAYTTANNTGATITIITPVDNINIINTNIISGSKVLLRNITKGTELDIATVGGGGYSFNTNVGASEAVSVGDTIRIYATYANGTSYKENYTEAAVATLSNMEFIGTQSDWTDANNLATDGSAQTEFTADYPNVQVDINSPDNYWQGAKFVAWYLYNQTTDDGIRNYFGSITSAGAVWTIATASADVYLDNVNSTSISQNDNVYVQRDDGIYPQANPTSGGGGIGMKQTGQVFVVTVAGASVITGTVTQVLDAIAEIPDPLTLPQFVALK